LERSVTESGEYTWQVQLTPLSVVGFLFSKY